MFLLYNKIEKIFFLGSFIIPTLVVQAWIGCPCTRDTNLLNSGQISSTTMLMTIDENNRPLSSSEEEDDVDGVNSQDEKLSRKYRLAKAQREIDRILNNPVDPPFDFENEMKKVSSISPPLIEEGTAEYQLEEQVSDMEEQLYDALKVQDYDTAAKKSSEISQTHVDDCGLVLQANSAFYRAFSDKNVADMERIWLNDRSCVCIHPSFKPLSGVVDIMSTWKRMFESSVGSFQRTWIDPCNIQLTVKATTAVVTCVEDVYARRFVRGKRRKSELVNKLTATNIFRKVGGRWYMTYHHSSWHADSEAAKRALKTRSKSEKTNASTSRRTLSSDPFGDNLLRSLGKDDHDDDDDEDVNDKPSELESILGLEKFGPLLGDESKSKQEGGATGPSIISSNLDFLKDLGNMDGMLGMSNADDTGLPPGSIIRISKINSKGDGDGDGNETDDYDEDDFDDDDDDGDGDTRNDRGKSILELLAEKKEKKKKMRSSMSIRTKCVEELRRLSKDGRISPNHKRVLLTDIISSSARREKSLVEHAYKVLCVDATDKEAAEEEFVDQCQVFAQSFLEIS